MTTLQRFACWMGWHRPSSKRTYDGCSWSAVCRNCGLHIMQDSQGNWF